MTIRNVEEAAQQVKSRKVAVVFAEKKLQESVSRFLLIYPGSIRAIARTMQLSVPYVSDIIHGRRKVSARVIEKLGLLK